VLLAMRPGWDFFRYEGFQEKIMEQIIKNDPILTKAHERYTEFTRNERLMEIYYARMKKPDSLMLRVKARSKLQKRCLMMECLLSKYQNTPTLL